MEFVNRKVNNINNFKTHAKREGFYFTVVDALLKTGFSENEIGKIGGGNFLRVFKGATKPGG